MPKLVIIIPTFLVIFILLLTHGAGGTFYVLSGDEEIWDLARKIQETYPEYREAME